MALAGLSFSIHNLPNKTKKDLTDLIKENGGDVAYIGKNITHLITTPEEISEGTTKVINAREKKIEVVTETWVHEKLKASKVKQKSKEATAKSLEINNGNTENQVTVIKKPVHAISMTAPTITMVLPEIGPCSGTFKVAVFGINFIASPNLQLQFGPFVKCTQIEFHCSTALVATVTTNEAQPGEVAVTASNDGGHHNGPSVPFTFYDNENRFTPVTSHQESITILQSQLQNMRRSISQLQAGMINVQKMELEIRNKVEKVATLPNLDDVEHITFEDEQQEQRTDGTGAPVASGKTKRVLSVKQDTSDREIRLFISSPFKDMQEERDIIAKKIVPKIRRMCTERDISFSFVDLRWGVTGVQSEQAATLLMCLRELERSNIFLGLYGERYGWCLTQHAQRNPSRDDELLKRTFEIAAKEFPWIEQYLDRSVTEVEMRMILDHAYKGNNKYAWFYFRDPYYVEQISKDKQHLFISEGEYEHEKLLKLKNEISESEYPNRPYTNPIQMEETLLADIEYYINQNYPKGTELSALDSERFRHNAFSKRLVKAYLPNEQNLVVLDRHASSTSNTPYVIIGPSGIGKSALIANWVKRYKEHHPEDIVISHYVGCSAASTNHISVLMRIMSEIQDQLNDYKTVVPTDPQVVVETFTNWIEKILERNKRHRLIILIDGIDNLEDRDNAMDLVWLPRKFHQSIRVFISTCEGKCWSILQRRGYEHLVMKPLQEAERVSYLRMKLNQSSKKLNEKQEFRIAGSDYAGVPRYLDTLIEDLTLFGEFDELDEKITRDLKATNASDLYEIVLARLEKDYDTSGKEVLPQFLSFLWASRRGLYLETELALLFQERKIEPHEWSAIYVVLEDLLFSSSGLLNFSNRDIRAAVENRYLPTTEKKRYYYDQLASFFVTMDSEDTRKSEELPYLLEQAEDWERLKSCISDLRIFIKLYTAANKFDLFRYWRKIESKTSYESVRSYTQSLSYTDQIPSGELVANVFYRVGYFLEETAKYAGAEEVYTKAKYYYLLQSQIIDVAKMEYTIARVLLQQARYKEAEEMLLKSQDIYTREKGENDIEVSHVLLRLGSLYSQIGRTTEAEATFVKCLQIREEKLGYQHSRVGQTLKHMLTFFEEAGQYEKAAEHGERALSITEQVFGPDDVNVAAILVRLGHLYMSQKRYALAKQTLKRALRISEAKYGREHPFVADIMYELGCFYFIKPEELNSNKSYTTDKADKLFAEALEIKKNTLGDNHPDVSRILTRMGSLCIERSEFVQAEAYLKQALKIREEKLGKDHSRVAQTLRHMITLYELQEKFAEAIKCAQTTLRISKRVHGEESLQVANVMLRLGQMYLYSDGNASFEGKRILKSVLSIREKKLGKDHKLTQEISKIIEELESPPPVAPQVSVVQAPVITSKPTQYVAAVQEEDLSFYGNVGSYDMMENEISIPLPPPPPPPLPTLKGGAPPPPPPPGSRLKSAPPPQSFTDVLQKPVALKRAMLNKRTNQDAQQGWWKQNYNYKK